MPRRHDYPPRGKPLTWQNGLGMITHFKGLQRTGPAPTKPKGIPVFRHFPLVIGLFAACGFAMSAAPASAQVNIDQGKTAAEMFSGDCATCHKSAKGLANGRGSGALAGFLREHYTSSAEQAASLAAYVLGAGSGPSPSANLKPGTSPGEPKASEAKPGERARPARGEAAATAKLQQSEGGKAEAEPEPGASAGRKPTTGRREPRPVTASRGPRQQPETPSPSPVPEAAPAPVPVPVPVATPETNPAPVATAPATPETSTPPAAPEPATPVTAAAPATAPEASAPSMPTPANAEAASSASATTTVSEAPAGEGAPAENAPVPRDNIPD